VLTSENDVRVVLEGAYIGKRCKREGELVAYSVCSKRTVGVRAVRLVLAATRCEGAVCAFLA
jgi:hypothetical protein